MSDLRDLFHRPTEHPIGGCTFTVHKVQFAQFSDALAIARYLEEVSGDFDMAELERLAAGSEERESLKRLLAGCLAVKVDEGLQQLQPQDVEVMPAPMLAEALAVVMEVNADFFFQSLPRLLHTGLRIRSTGSALLNRLSAQATAPTA